MNRKKLFKNLIIASTVGFLLSILFIAFIGEFFYHKEFILGNNINSNHWIFVNKLSSKINSNKQYLYEKNNKYYLSRCVGMPGDSIEIKAGNLLINKKRRNNPYLQFLYQLTSKNRLSDSLIKYHVDFKESNLNHIYIYDAILNTKEAINVKKNTVFYSFKRKTIAINDLNIKNVDFFTKRLIPKKLDTVVFDSSLLEFYAKINSNIKPYNKEKLYFIAQNNYYFMLNDNRNLVSDSRVLGLIKRTEIIGNIKDIHTRE